MIKINNRKFDIGEISHLTKISCWISCGLSYAINKSLLWSLLHFFLGWIYLGYQFGLWIIKWFTMNGFVCSACLQFQWWLCGSCSCSDFLNVRRYMIIYLIMFFSAILFALVDTIFFLPKRMKDWWDE